MIGTIIAGSTAVFLGATAALDIVDGIVDRRRQSTLKLKAAAPRVQTPVAQTWEAPEKLLKAA